jgi:hypothetical protein
MFTIIRRADYLPEDRAVTELRRATSVSAARRIAHEVAYRFFESAALLDRRIAHETIADILRWNGDKAIQVALNDGNRFSLSVQ